MNPTHHRRDFARWLALGGAALASRSPAAALADDTSWTAVRAKFMLPPDVVYLNAANLCPAPEPVAQAVQNATDLDHDLSAANRSRIREAKETTRRALAEFLRVTPEEIVITRNTSEGNNLVSSGLDLKPGDEVLLFSDNHPSNHAAWTAKAKRWGYAVKFVEQANPHPGFDYYLKAFSSQMTARTKLLGFTHLTNTAGDLFPARELCRMARERGVLTLLDGAQSFGLMDVDLSEIQPDFYTGSGHKWLCGPKETGVLYVRRDALPRLSPSVVSLYSGAVGASRTLEGFGQRDETALAGLGQALGFHTIIGRKRIEERSRSLATQFIAGLEEIKGVKLWTSKDASLRHSVVAFQPGSLDPAKTVAALYERHRFIVTTSAGGPERRGLRVSAHFYNSPAEIQRLLAAMERSIAAGL